MALDWLPDGRLLIVSSELQLQEPDRFLGACMPTCPISPRGGTRSSSMAAVTPTSTRLASTDGGRGNGQRQHRAGHPCRFGPPGDRRGVVPQRHGRYPDNPTLIVAESYSSRLTAFDINQSGNLPQCPGREE
jgi:hypothetical protein